MSRIDEALRRASRPAAPLEPVEGNLAKGALDTYVREAGIPERQDFDRDLPESPREAARVAVAGGEAVAYQPVAAPRAAETGRHSWRFPEAYEGKLVVSASISPVSLEQYRRLAGAMHALQVERSLTTLMVTSTVPSEGKTLTVANLAMTLTESYARRVLLIDADLRRPTVHQVFGLPNVAGLADVLRMDHGPISVLQVSKLLSVLPAGRLDASPMAGLTSDRMRALLEQSATEFDWVLLDAPPVAGMPDASLVAGLTRAVLFVIEAGTTQYGLIDKAMTELGREYVVGTVLNRVQDHNIPTNAYFEEYYPPNRLQP
jgi:capsular exopolysaccharide synthesis family protein